MPNTREKLIELLNNSFEEQYSKRGLLTAPHTADDLIANGVTVQKWIPVTERLPEDVCGKDRDKIVVLVRTESGNVSQCSRIAEYDCSSDATLSNIKWTKNGQFYWSKGKRVTHWMPLPQPPKGD